jgi:hypothetical protein
MNPKVEKVQHMYRSSRKEANYSIFDIETMLKKLADSGVIWMLKDMEDLTSAESILINYYLHEKRELQTYDSV